MQNCQCKKKNHNQEILLDGKSFKKEVSQSAYIPKMSVTVLQLSSLYSFKFADMNVWQVIYKEKGPSCDPVMG